MHRHGDQQQHLPFRRAEIARGALDVDLVVAHLAVDDGKAERQVDHDMADAGGEQRLRHAGPVEQHQQPHADDEIADRQRQRDQPAQQRRARQHEARKAPGGEEAERDGGGRGEHRHQQRIDQRRGQPRVGEHRLVPAQRRAGEGRHREATSPGTRTAPARRPAGR